MNISELRESNELVNLFCTLAEIPSPSLQEEKVIEKVKKLCPHVDIIFGTHNIYKFAELLVNSFESKRMVIDIWKDTDQIVEDLH